MLEGKTVNLRVMEKEDVDYLFECINEIDIWGEYNPVDEQVSKSELMKRFETILQTWKSFLSLRRSSFRRRTELEHLEIIKVNESKTMRLGGA